MPPPMRFVQAGHLGGYIAADAHHPHGDPATYFPALWDWLIAQFRPQTVLDVGCGEGHALDYFLQAGGRAAAGQPGHFPAGIYALGIEGCRQALAAGVVPPGRIVLHDFTTGPVALPPLVARAGFDLVWSCEFVEHVAARYREHFLAAFALGRVVAMTHAEPGQGGHHHVNEQPRDYWVSALAAHGFALDAARTAASRRLDPSGHWRRSGLIFTKV